MHVDQCGQLRAQARHFDRLVDEGMLQTHGGGGKRETLAGSPGENPVLWIVLPTDKNGDARR